MKTRKCLNCKTILNEWAPPTCPDCGRPTDEQESQADAVALEVDLEALDAAFVKRVPAYEKVNALASSIWSALRCRSYSLDSERWTKVVQELLSDLVDEFKDDIEKLDRKHGERVELCRKMQKRLRRYQIKHGCIECGKPVAPKSTTDKCASCCHHEQKVELLSRGEDLLADLPHAEEELCDD